MFSSKTEMWATPQWFFDNVNKSFNFTLDVCAIHENAKCANFFSPKENGLIQEWTGICWMNPPYGRTIKDWVEKAYTESIIKNQCTVVALVPSRTDTKWFHEYIYNKPGVAIQFIKGRLCFVSKNTTNPAPFPSMLVTFNKNFMQLIK